MPERRFQAKIERLRAPERLARLEVERVIQASLEGLKRSVRPSTTIRNTVTFVRGETKGQIATALCIRAEEVAR